MQTAASNSLLLTDISSLTRLTESPRKTSYGGLYQQIALGLIKGVYTNQVLTVLGDRLVALAEQAYAFREMHTVEQASQMLLNLPLPRQYEVIGHHYRALYLYKLGQYDNTRVLLERVAEEAPPRYRARAILSLGAVSAGVGDLSSELLFYIEAGRAAQDNWCDSFSIVQAQRGIAVLKSIDGDHRGALADLEKLFPLARTVASKYPQMYYDYLNSLAMELNEVGRLEEAQNACRIVLASPYAHAYPEWHETRDEIALKLRRASRSVVAFNSKTFEAENIVALSVPERGQNTKSSQTYPKYHKQPARILSFQEWKKMTRQSNDMPREKLTRQQIQQMSLAEKQARLVRFICGEEVSEEMLNILLEILEKPVSEKEDQS